MQTGILVEPDGAYVGATELPLTALELKVLNSLAQARGATVSVADLHAAMYGHAGNAKASNVLQVVIRRLRMKLVAAGAGVRIDNVRGQGYALQPSVEAQTEAAPA